MNKGKRKDRCSHIPVLPLVYSVVGRRKKARDPAPVLLTTSVGYGFASVNVLEQCVNRLKQWRGGAG